jgi:hypothetical protein
MRDSCLVDVGRACGSTAGGNAGHGPRVEGPRSSSAVSQLSLRRCSVSPSKVSRRCRTGLSADWLACAAIALPLPASIDGHGPGNFVGPPPRERGAELGIEPRGHPLRHGPAESRDTECGRGVECCLEGADVVRVPVTPPRSKVTSWVGWTRTRCRRCPWLGRRRLPRPSRRPTSAAAVSSAARTSASSPGLPCSRGNALPPVMFPPAGRSAAAEQPPRLPFGLLGGAGAALGGGYVTEYLFDVVAAAPVGRLRTLRTDNPLAHLCSSTILRVRLRLHYTPGGYRREVVVRSGSQGLWKFPAERCDAGCVQRDRCVLHAPWGTRRNGGTCATLDLDTPWGMRREDS